jgi:CMP-N-acetylneuraminic acid synthetase
MYKEKTFLAVIPARSGSKGVKDKNIRELRGKPLMAYSIEAALASGVMDAVVVSTDSERYAEVARRYGAVVPFLRPSGLAGDKTLASEYITYNIERLSATGRVYDYFVLLQPTSPLRTAGHILEGVRMAVEEGLDSVVAFSEAEHPIENYFRLPGDMRLGGLTVKEANRQEYEPSYRVNGMLYICKCAEYLKTRGFYGPNGKALVIGKEYAVDIDGEYDFVLAEFLMGRYS